MTEREELLERLKELEQEEKEKIVEEKKEIKNIKFRLTQKTKREFNKNYGVNITKVKASIVDLVSRTGKEMTEKEQLETGALFYKNILEEFKNETNIYIPYNHSTIFSADRHFAEPF